MLNYLKILEDKLKEGEKIVLVTVVEADGSSPGKPGFKMLVNEKGRIFGTVGGGGTEATAINNAKKLIKEFDKYNKKTMLESFNLDKEGSNEFALCGGKITLYYEVFAPERKVYIFGAGHVGSKIAHLLKILGFFVVVIDDRKSVLEELKEDSYNEKLFMNYTKDLENKIKNLNIEQGSFVIILTHGHQFDYDILLNIYRNYTNLRYVGMIGSKEKVKELVSNLKKEIKNVNLENLYSPIGIKIGGNSAAEIALSIAAEIQSIIYEKDVPHYRINYNNL